MKNLYLLIGVSAVIAGCGGGTPGTNPKQLWLALNGSERAVQLIDHEPSPF
jgi:hypothetical protein